MRLGRASLHVAVAVEAGGARVISKDGTSSSCVARAGATHMICATEADSSSLCAILALRDRCFNVILGPFPSIFIWLSLSIDLDVPPCPSKIFSQSMWDSSLRSMRCQLHVFFPFMICCTEVLHAKYMIWLHVGMPAFKWHLDNVLVVKSLWHILVDDNVCYLFLFNHCALIFY